VHARLIVHAVVHGELLRFRLRSGFVLADHRDEALSVAGSEVESAVQPRPRPIEGASRAGTRVDSGGH
jgi:hypothetical protein